MTRLAVLVLLVAQVARADSSVTKRAENTGWCLARYEKEARRNSPKASPSPGANAASFKLGAVTLHFELPPTFVAAAIGADLIQVGSGGAGTDDAFFGWRSTLQLRWQTRAQLETRINAIPSDFTGSTRATIETRPVAGKAVEELCAIVRRTAGHATTTDGVHHAMPQTFELVHGYLYSIHGKTFSAVYRLSPESFDQQPLWERVLDSLTLN